MLHISFASGFAIQDQELYAEVEASREKLGKALGRLASGVYVVTLEQDGKRHGVLTTWIAQASFSPPLVTVVFNKERHILACIKEGVVFAINILSKDNRDIFKNFARSSTKGEDRFAGLQLVACSNAGPVFADVVAYLGCRTNALMELGDHVMVVAEVVDGQVLAANTDPMIHLRGSGFHY